MPDFSDDTKRILKEQRDELNQILNNEAWGALVGAHFQHVNEVDTCSSYCFNLENLIPSLNLDEGAQRQIK